MDFLLGAIGFPVAHEVFDGDTADVTTLEEIVDKIQTKHGMRGRVWCLIAALSARTTCRILATRSFLSGGHSAPRARQLRARVA